MVTAIEHELRHGKIKSSGRKPTLVEIYDMAEAEKGAFVGSCPVCGLHYNGREHLCPGQSVDHMIVQLSTLQHFADEHNDVEYRTFNSRLEDGFAMLTESGGFGDS